MAGHPYAVVDYAAVLTRLLDKVRREAHGKLRSVTVVEEIVIGADRSMTSKRVIQTLIAVKEVDRQIVVHQGEPGCDITLIRPRGLTGCRTGRVARDADAGALLGELLLDRTLNVSTTDSTSGPAPTTYWRSSSIVTPCQFASTSSAARIPTPPTPSIAN